MLGGLQGAGKTTTTTKLGKYYQDLGFTVGIVCTDTFRAGALAQLRQNCKKAGLELYGSDTLVDPVQLASDGLKHFKKKQIVIIDTSGRNAQSQELLSEMKEIQATAKADAILYVLDGTVGQAADAQVRAFQGAVNIGALILTKMDGDAKGGGCLSAVARCGAPILFIGTGEHVSDFEAFHPKKFVANLLGLNPLGNLMEKVGSNKDTPGLMEDIVKGSSSLRSFQGQLKMIESLGPLSKVMGMIPGLPKEMKNMNDKDTSAKISTTMAIFSSMTRKELDSNGRILEEQPNRVYRLARGAGVGVRDVESLLMQAKQFEGLYKGIGGMFSGNMPSAATGMSGMQAGMPNMGGMDIQGMMQQMSQGGGLQNLMSSMSGGGGGFDIAGLMSKMGLGENKQ